MHRQLKKDRTALQGRAHFEPATDQATLARRTPIGSRTTELLHQAFERPDDACIPRVILFLFQAQPPEVREPKLRQCEPDLSGKLAMPSSRTTACRSPRFPRCKHGLTAPRKHSWQGSRLSEQTPGCRLLDEKHLVPATSLVINAHRFQ